MRVRRRGRGREQQARDAQTPKARVVSPLAFFRLSARIGSVERTGLGSTRLGQRGSQSEGSHRELRVLLLAAEDG